jgi:stress-induced morphogen
MTSEQIKQRIIEHLPDAKVSAQDLTGGGDHWSVTVVASDFKGLSMVKQHQLIYKALGDWMKKEIHALALTTRES